MPRSSFRSLDAKRVLSASRVHQWHRHPRWQRLGSFKNGNPINRVRDEMRKDDPTAQVNGSLNALMQANLFRVSYDPKRILKLPHDYGYSNGKPNQVVEPAVLWGTVPEKAKSQPKRVQFASWLTSTDNPRFAKTLANRLWKKVMGVGLIEPVDDLQDDSVCENPELLKFLSDELVRLKFDQKEFLRMLYYTKTYSRASSPFDVSKGELYHYPGPTLRRMSAEQVWDSILSIAVYNPYPYETAINRSVRSSCGFGFGQRNGC